eukprot:g29062.t1
MPMQARRSLPTKRIHHCTWPVAISSCRRWSSCFRRQLTPLQRTTLGSRLCTSQLPLQRLKGVMFGRPKQCCFWSAVGRISLPVIGHGLRDGGRSDARIPSDRPRQGKTPAAIARLAGGQPSLTSLLQAESLETSGFVLPGSPSHTAEVKLKRLAAELLEDSEPPSKDLAARVSELELELLG